MIETKLITSVVELDYDGITIMAENGQYLYLTREEVIKLVDVLKIWQTVKVKS